MTALLSGFRSQVSSLLLGFRWFGLNIALILVCTGILFWKQVSISVIRWQIRLARWSGLFLLAFSLSLLVFLPGCATAPHRPSIAPSMAAVSIPLQGTRDAIAVAQDRLKAGDIPATASALSTAAAKADVTAQALSATQRNVDALEAKLGTADAVIAAQKAELHQVAKERDIIPYLVALCLALWLVFFTDGLPIPDQYRFGVKIGAFFLGFGAGYATGRTIVRFIAGFLP